MSSLPSFLRSRLSTARTVIAERLRAGDEATKATRYWAELASYHTAADGPLDIERSQWVASQVGSLGISSLLEIGTNNGRNLRFVRAVHPGMRLRGIDVNPMAIEMAQSSGLDIDFALADANSWHEGIWDAILTMSVLDHIPDAATEILAANIASSATYIISVELWDGSPGTRGLYKYSRNTADLFARHGFETLHWEVSVGQYDTKRSLLWAYVGKRVVS